jgi:hypothetical protein
MEVEDMKTNKVIWIGLACILIVGCAAFFLLNGSQIGTVAPETVNNTPAPDANVEDIAPAEPIGVQPPAISPSATPEAMPDVINPGNADAGVTVPLTQPTARPAEANPDVHEKGDENEPPMPTATPPARTPKPTAAPSNLSEPKSGDTNDKGQVWFPGFGWVTPGGGNEVKESGSDGDINKPVGEM